MAGDLYVDIVDAINDIAGRHEGRRAVHAKGTLCHATFSALPAAAQLCRAPHLQGGAVRGHVRFSNGSGGPSAPDGAQDGRGMALKLYLDDGATTDIVCISRRQFFVRTPEDFLAFTRARRPDPETGELDLAKVGEFLGAHPEAGPAVQEQLAARPPVSYARLEYNGIHAFRLLDAQGAARWVRYRWTPEEGAAVHPEGETPDLSDDYLQEELAARLGAGRPARFTLSVALAQEGDPIEDPTLAWPEERERVDIARLEVTGIATDRERDGDVLVFDPTRVSDGIELSEDRILHARSPAYSESVKRRAGVGREAAPPTIAR